MVRRCPVCSGVSRTISTSLRRSFSTTSADLVSSVEVTPVAISDILRMEQGATNIPSVMKEPLAILAPTFLIGCTSLARPATSDADISSS